MIHIVFTPNLHKHLDIKAMAVSADNLRAALDSVFISNPRLRSYLLDDQQRLRQHVMIFINGEQCRDRFQLNDPLSENDEIFIAQALSGG